MWYNKNFTTSSDLYGILEFCVSVGMPPRAIEILVEGLSPESGWVEDSFYSPTSRTRKESHFYPAIVDNIIAGYWRPYED